MSRQSEANSREKTIGENVVIIAMVAILMGSFIYYFFKQEQQLTQVGFDSVASNFSAKVMAIRAQWFMDNQPTIINLKEGEQGESAFVEVNNNGWVDYVSDANNCQKIWQAVLSGGLTFMNQNVVVLEIKNEVNRLKNVCRYSLPSGEYFDYYLETGKVTEVKLRR